LKILYVEDNDDLRTAMADLLRGDGDDREVVACANGDDALALFQSERFDVVVTDVRLPGMSGTELARTILRERPLQWIVLCSGFDAHDWTEQLGRNVRSLPKPFDLDVMEALMAEIAACPTGDAPVPQ
jgi:two-component system cell cycle response regulator CpdR